MRQNTEQRQKRLIDWEQFGILIEKLATLILQDGRKFDSIYGVPRNGTIIAAILAKILHLKQVDKPTSVQTLIVDDISDSGKTLFPIKTSFCSNVIATIHYRQDTQVIPDIVVEDAKEYWLTYPWEYRE